MLVNPMFSASTPTVSEHLAATEAAAPKSPPRNHGNPRAAQAPSTDTHSASVDTVANGSGMPAEPTSTQPPLRLSYSTSGDYGLVEPSDLTASPAYATSGILLTHRGQTAAVPVNAAPSNGVYTGLIDRDSSPTPPRPEYGLLNDAGVCATNFPQMHHAIYDVLARAGRSRLDVTKPGPTSGSATVPALPTASHDPVYEVSDRDGAVLGRPGSSEAHAGAGVPNHPEYTLLNDTGMYATNLPQTHQEGYAVLERAGGDHGSAGQTYAVPMDVGSSA